MLLADDQPVMGEDVWQMLLPETNPWVVAQANSAAQALALLAHRSRGHVGLLALGIAQTLCIRVRTVETPRRNLPVKIECKQMVGLTQQAIRPNLL